MKPEFGDEYKRNYCTDAGTYSKGDGMPSRTQGHRSKGMEGRQGAMSIFRGVWNDFTGSGAYFKRDVRFPETQEHIKVIASGMECLHSPRGIFQGDGMSSRTQEPISSGQECLPGPRSIFQAVCSVFTALGAYFTRG